MNRIRKLVLTTTAATLLALVAAALFLALAERRVDRRLLELKLALGGQAESADPLHLEEIHSRLVALDRYLEQRAPAKDGLGSPTMWVPARRPELERKLATLGSFFEQTDAILADEICRYQLQHGGVDASGAPDLGRSRHRTNVLCARALVEFDGPDGSRAAARRLAEAFDLIRLGDDGQSFGYLSSVALEDIALLALQRLVEDPRANAGIFEEELSGRLAGLAAERRARTAVVGELGDAIACAERTAARDRPAPLARYGAWIEKKRIADALAEFLSLSAMPATEAQRAFESFSGPDPSLPWLPSLRQLCSTSRIAMARRNVARAALEVARETREPGIGRASLPTDPYTGLALERKETERAVSVGSPDALAALHMKAGDPGSELFCWTIPR